MHHIRISQHANPVRSNFHPHDLTPSTPNTLPRQIRRAAGPSSATTLPNPPPCAYTLSSSSASSSSSPPTLLPRSKPSAPNNTPAQSAPPPPAALGSSPTTGCLAAYLLARTRGSWSAFRSTSTASGGARAASFALEDSSAEMRSV